VEGYFAAMPDINFLGFPNAGGYYVRFLF